MKSMEKLTIGSTRISGRVNASRAIVYRALLDARAVETWLAPRGARSTFSVQSAIQIIYGFSTVG
jgi:uncharacterized protein YndB with AHSA1/START domain